MNYVLNDVKNPVRTLKIAGPLGLGICAILYILANLAYFAYVVAVFFFFFCVIDDDTQFSFEELQHRKRSRVLESLSQLCFLKMYSGLKRREHLRLLFLWGNFVVSTLVGMVFDIGLHIVHWETSSQLWVFSIFIWTVTIPNGHCTCIDLLSFANQPR